MKRYFILVAALLAVCGSKVFADTRLVPQGGGSHLATADYGGVSYSTIAFSSANVLNFSGPGSVVGIVVSSFAFSATSPWVSFRDTHSILGSGTDYTTTDEYVRVNLTTQTLHTGTVAFPGTGNFVFTFPKPIKVRLGSAVKASVSTLNLITVLYTKFD